MSTVLPKANETITEYLSKPSPLPDILGNEMSLDDYGNKLLKDNIKAAIEAKILPSSLSFIQYFHVSSVLEKNPFAAPIIIRKENKLEILSAWAHFRAPGKKHISLIENTVREKKSGCTFIISRSNSQVGKNLKKTYIVQLTDSCASSEFTFPSNFIDSLEDEKIGGDFILLKEKTVEKLFHEYEECSHEDHFSSIINIQTEAEKLLKKTLLPGEDYKDYFHRLSNLVKKVDVVFCIPKLYKNYSDSESQSGGGCVFFLNEPVDDLTLNKLFVISFKLCSVASSVYDLIRTARLNIESELWGSIRHSIQGVYTKEISTDTPNDVVRRILRLELLAIDATSWQLQSLQKIKPVLWRTGGIDKESIGETIAGSVKNYQFELDFDDEGILSHHIDQRLIVIVVELARNLKKSRLVKKGKISIFKMPSNNSVSIQMKTPCTAEDARKIYNKLTNSDPEKDGGVRWVSKLCSILSDAGVGNIKWTFLKEDNDGDDEIETNTFIKSCIINHPSNLLELNKNAILQMEFRADGLNVIR